MPAGSSNTILIVDDDRVNGRILANLVSRESAVILETSGARALDLCQNRNDISLILLDISMPEMDGYQVLDALRNDKRTAAIPVIFVTAMTTAEEEVRGLTQGAVDFIRKPIHPAVLVARIRIHLRIHSDNHDSRAVEKEVASRAVGGLPPRKLAIVKEFIEENLPFEISIDSLAKRINLSVPYFSNSFKNATGMSPYQYIIAQRLERAKNLLLQSSRPISEVAVEAGFADQSHLTRLMRKLTGMTPGMIRDELAVERNGKVTVAAL